MFRLISVLLVCSLVCRSASAQFSIVHDPGIRSQPGAPSEGPIQLSEPSAKNLRRIFTKDSADFQGPSSSMLVPVSGLPVFRINGQQPACYTINDTTTGTHTTYFADSRTFSTLWTVPETGMGNRTVVSILCAAPWTAPNEPSTGIWTNNPSAKLAVGGTTFRMFDQAGGTSLEQFRSWSTPPSLGVSGNIVPVGLIYDAPQRDLTGDGIMETIQTGVYHDGSSYRVWARIFNKDRYIDTIVDESYYLFKCAIGSTHDVNGNGKDEIAIYSDAGKVRFFEWHASNAQFEKVATLDINESLDMVTHDVDGSGKQYLVTVQSGMMTDTLVVYDHQGNALYRVSTDEPIEDYIVADLLGNGHEQVIIVVLNTKHNSSSKSLYATYVYDFATGLEPIWADTTSFEAEFATDLMGTGRKQLIGYGAKELYQKTLKVVNPANNWETVWELGTTGVPVKDIAGPFIAAGAKLPVQLVTAWLRSRVLSPTDVNGDGQKDFVYQVYRGYPPEKYFLVVGADGVIVDTIRQLAQPTNSGAPYVSAYCTSHDLNGNGTAELLFTEYTADPDYNPYPLRGTVWDWNEVARVTSRLDVNDPPKVFPNPSTGNVWVLADGYANQGYSLQASNSLGQIVYTSSGIIGSDCRIGLDLRDLVGGYHAMELQTDLDVRRTSFLIQR